MKKIVIINGHPNKESFNSALVHAYEEGALGQQAEIRVIPIGELQFNPNLQYGYQQRMELEPDLMQAWDSILWADHLVWVHPVWWGGLPAVTKGFVDRLFLPGMAYKYRPNSVWWDKLLSGKTAHIITTLDQPGWYYRLFFGRPSVNQLKKSILEFCGIKPVKVTYVGVIRNSTDAQRTKWLDKVRGIGRRLI
ncbi:NAD(P)H-dependent oxidoreductase [Sphingobacterium yanglingense]|uniref:Putative NADPH-quinone reductase n=1 Tax=Sphingobacterium yanglingense TaxID=1437280 RepID=A0A4R6WHS9_9SPHI|nr:NAD(P)H-dependent oxidoreductase [Sphingobacterium yanglingense]TDQ78076.1 putative NADPH-quinone reductase [Sphingobacterium yanglingense]